MTDDKPRRRSISDEDQALWRSVTRSISPLKRNRRGAETASAAHSPKQAAETSSRPVPAAVPKPPKPPKSPPLADFDRRTKQRLARGRDSIGARLDLHGRSQTQAHSALLRFLRQAQADHVKTALVITGKGGDSAGERGVLRRQVPLWLALPEFRSLVVGFETASVGHGGQGALYVRVRRGR